MLFRKTFSLFCIMATLLLSGCMTAHKVKPAKIDTSEPYRIGIVKVKGTIPLPFVSGVEKKTLALNNIQYDEICQIIENEYGIKINTEINDKKPKTVVEYEMKNPIKNVYFGNDTYVQKSPVAVAGLFNNYKRENIDDKNHIDITYYITSNKNPFALPKLKLYYEIIARKNNEEIFIHKDEIRNVSIPMNAIFNISEELERLWAQVIVTSQDIDEALFIGLNK